MTASSQRPIKTLAPHTCPQCGAEGMFAVREEAITCQRCGYVVRRDDGHPQKPTEAAPPKPVTQPRKPLTPSYAVTTPGAIDAWARAAFDSGQDCIRQGKYDDAVTNFKRSIEYQKDFIDPYLWIARIVDDPKVKRDNLETVLAHNPNHLEALRELMILRGELSPDTPSPYEPYREPEVMEAGGAVGTKTKNVRCPKCGSPNMTTDTMTGLVVCGSCGHVRRDERQRAGEESLTLALLKRRAQAVVWKVGQRLLECTSCGAQRTISAEKLSERCPFCGSTHVIERDALDSFQQPDGIIPFAITRNQAGELINERLAGWMQRVSNWFNSNKVERGSLEGMYLPFWAFDAMVEVRKSVFRNNPGMTRERLTGQRTMQSGYETNVIPDAMNDVLVCGVKSPSPLLVGRLGKYTLGDIVAYDPALLADHPAGLYSMDFDEASLEARSTIGQTMRERHGLFKEGNAETTITTSVTGMSFQLVLLPVWVATLYEDDGDIRTALVNGQTGRVALGKAKKSK